ncbi:MAG: PQQ-dependent sugar dehydrogenase [Nitrososphaeraceae archaeon]|nr:PQQ-dependent sugar dehydrogenase [Nitrososphaeraceae archaeon]
MIDHICRVILMTFFISNIVPISYFVKATALPNIVNFSLKPEIIHIKPNIKDPHLKVEEVAHGLQLPTSMVFLGPNDILVLEKDKGTVQRIVNGKMLQQPLAHVDVANYMERGLLGIAIAKDNGHTYVFLSFTESGGGKTGDDVIEGTPPLGNILYRYELVNDTSGNPKLLPDLLLLLLPATPGPFHNGGKIVIGPDKNIYYVIGEVSFPSRTVISPSSTHRTKAQNFENGTEPDGTSGILRVTQNGTAVGHGILGSDYPLNLYYAYGIRNSFGMDFDPVTGNLWDTENGQRNADEINLVEPGFNSGWRAVQGMWNQKDLVYAGNLTTKPNNLVDFAGKGKYRSPEFIWNIPVGPTAIKFLNSAKLGKQYENDMFVGDFNNGRIYNFKLNKDRTGLILKGVLADKVAKSDKDLKDVIFGEGFGGITDLEVGPDGYLYVVSIGQGKIYRIVPDDLNNTGAITTQAIPAGLSLAQTNRVEARTHDNNITTFSRIEEARIHLNQAILALHSFNDTQGALDQLNLADQQLLASSGGYNASYGRGR